MKRKHFLFIIFILLGAFIAKIIKLFFFMDKKDSNTKLDPNKLKEAKYYETFKEMYVRCNLCFRRCIIADEHTGFCRVRKNKKGKLYSLVYSLPSAIFSDWLCW